ncbi:YdcF family protein [Coralloluteibacterium stylophorae]|uniref:YdcF family protein n=1 Tax=Coralloluteibacterium stylophorae TaxID=1776034 RepID=A0A8J7VTC3_9GAMM|nr:YdcF family protein [Coralloluteibacterium stylophorae]MBS7458759.1 YdcF family protein [Coralloluteibacterium stylophorae]
MPAADPHLHRDILHSALVSALVAVLTLGGLYLAFLWRTWRTARLAPTDVEHEVVLVFGKRLVDGLPDADFRARLERAHVLATARPGRILMLMGGGAPGANEAEAAREALALMGLPADVPVLLEAASLDTLQNLRNARALLAAQGLARARVALVSSRYHLARCAAFARSLGVHGDPVAATAEMARGWRSWRRLAGEAGYLCWFEVGSAWARLIGHRRMLARVT